MKKAIFTVLALLAFGKCFAQSTGYSLPLPEKWRSETIPFPIDFAPSIPYQGIEEIRFTPGWGDAHSNEYWAYTFLWFVDGAPEITTNALNSNLNAYFDGLYNSNTKFRSTGVSTPATKTLIDKVATASGDKETYSGVISTLNYMTSKPISLFVMIHVQNYPDAKESAVFFELSSKPYNNPVWQQLDGIVQGFQLQK